MTTYREFSTGDPIEDKEASGRSRRSSCTGRGRPAKCSTTAGRLRPVVPSRGNQPCYNALDGTSGARGDQKALVYISTETGEERSFSYRELHLEVQRAAAMMRSLGVGKGDRSSSTCP